MNGGSELISVVVPVYNVERYLGKCLESIVRQTYANIEIVLVDDGSTDSGGQICDLYANKDSRVKVIHKKNGGLSDARNKGIEESKGKYLIFVDSDDVIDETLVEYLYNLVKTEGAEIGVCDFLHCYEGSDIRFTEETSRRTFSGESAIAEMLYQTSFLVAACAKIFRRELFDTILFPLGMLYEDSAIMYKIFDRADTVVYGNAKLYGYMHRDNSITTKKFTCSDLDIITISQQIVRDFENRDRLLKNAARSYYVTACLRVFLNAPRTGSFDRCIEDCKHSVEDNAIRCILDRRIRNKLRMSLLLFLFSKAMLFKVYEKIDRWS